MQTDIILINWKIIIGIDGNKFSFKMPIFLPKIGRRRDRTELLVIRQNGLREQMFRVNRRVNSDQWMAS